MSDLPEAAVQEPWEQRCDYRCSLQRGHYGPHLFPIAALGDIARSKRAAQPPPASVETEGLDVEVRQLLACAQPGLGMNPVEWHRRVQHLLEQREGTP